MNAITLTVQKLIETVEVSNSVGATLHHAAIYPVRLPDGYDGSGIIVNRVHEEIEDGTTHALVAVTLYETGFDRIEEIGASVVDALSDGEAEWSHGDAIDVQFVKTGPDVTGWDDSRKMYVRTIEFGVAW